MSKNEQVIYDLIVSQIRMGFYSIEEIKDNVVEEIKDKGSKNSISKSWAIKQVDKEFAKFLDESKEWKKPTDTDRLIKAFDELCENNIIALHNAGYTINDGKDEVSEIEEELRENGLVSDGYCFYNEHDLQNSLLDENLHITFQKIGNTDDDVAVGVGKKVVQILEKHGFEIEWDEKANKTITIKSFKWQLLYNENSRDLWDYEEVIDIMLG